MIACKKGYESVVWFLISHGADINKQNDLGYSPLIFGAIEGKVSEKNKIFDKQKSRQVVVYLLFFPLNSFKMVATIGYPNKNLEAN